MYTESTPMAENYKRKAHADVADKQLKNISIGDYVEIVTYGRVCELRDGYSYDIMPCGCPEKTKDKEKRKKEKYPAQITIDVEKTMVRETEKNSVPPDDED